MTCTDVSSPERNLPAIFLTTLLPSPSPSPTQTSSSALRDDFEVRFPRRDAPKKEPDAEEKQKRCRRRLLLFVSKQRLDDDALKDHHEGGVDNMILDVTMYDFLRGVFVCVRAFFFGETKNDSHRKNMTRRRRRRRRRRHKDVHKTVGRLQKKKAKRGAKRAAEYLGFHFFDFVSLNSCSGETKRDTKRRSTLHTTFEKTASRTDEDDEDDDEDDDKRSSSVPPRALVCFFFLRGRERE